MFFGDFLISGVVREPLELVAPRSKEARSSSSAGELRRALGVPPSLWELELDWRPELRAWDEWTAVDVLLYIDSFFEALRGRACQEAILRLLASETAALLVELQADVLSFANEDCRHSALGHGVFAPCLFMVTSPQRLPAAGLSGSQAVDDSVMVEWLANPASSSEELDAWETWPTFERCRAHLRRELNLWPLDG